MASRKTLLASRSDFASRVLDGFDGWGNADLGVFSSSTFFDVVCGWSPAPGCDDLGCVSFLPEDCISDKSRSTESGSAESFFEVRLTPIFFSFSTKSPSGELSYPQYNKSNAVKFSIGALNFSGDFFGGYFTSTISPFSCTHCLKSLPEFAA